MKDALKRYFKIESDRYKFEWNDLRCIITLLNVILIMIFGLSVAWFGLAIACLGLIKDLLVDRHISGIVMHLSNIALNIYFVLLI